MRYFTEEWHKRMGHTSIHTWFQSDERAGVYDDALYEALYQAEMDEMIAHSWDIPKTLETIHEDIKFTMDDFEGACRNALPAALLSEVADMRVFALHVAAPAIIEKMRIVSYENRLIVAVARDAYRKRLEEIDSLLSEDTKKYIHGLHDALITSVEQCDETVFIHIESHVHYDKLVRITLTGCEIVQLDAAFNGAWWFDAEVDIEADGRHYICISYMQDGTNIDEMCFMADAIAFTTDVYTQEELDAQAQLYNALENGTAMSIQQLVEKHKDDAFKHLYDDRAQYQAYLKQRAAEQTSPPPSIDKEQNA